MANNYFQFKQFKIIQEKSAMKVGTDGALLGAWTNILGIKKVLDVGAGTGLISLMIAQRSSAKIIGIEIEKNAAEEANENIQRSRWKNRVAIENISFQEFEISTKEKFDLIISNPPFFSNSYKNENTNLAIARHNDLLPFSDLIKCSVNLLSENGKLAIILPVIQAKIFIELTKKEGLNLSRLTKVKPNAKKETNRFLMEFTQKETLLKTDYLTIYTERGTDYTESYKQLTRDFYLKF
ncbi:MAG: methyltransferase [Draconibacterium sp.]|nr:methyltransferase [Draconibacterium sp.]